MALYLGENYIGNTAFPQVSGSKIEQVCDIIFTAEDFTSIDESEDNTFHFNEIGQQKTIPLLNILKENSPNNLLLFGEVELADAVASCIFSKGRILDQNFLFTTALNDATLLITEVGVQTSIPSPDESTEGFFFAIRVYRFAN